MKRTAPTETGHRLETESGNRSATIVLRKRHDAQPRTETAACCSTWKRPTSRKPPPKLQRLAQPANIPGSWNAMLHQKAATVPKPRSETAAHRSTRKTPNVPKRRSEPSSRCSTRKPPSGCSTWKRHPAAPHGSRLWKLKRTARPGSGQRR